MCHPNFTATKIVAFSIYMENIFTYFNFDFSISFDVFFSLHKKKLLTITPPKHVQTLLFYQL